MMKNLLRLLKGKVGDLTLGYSFRYSGYVSQQFDQTEISEENVVVEIKYDRAELTLTYAVNGGSYLPKETSTLGGRIILKTPSREGYDFDGWYLDENFEGYSIKRSCIRG